MADSRSLTARRTDEGDLLLEGQDLGPSTGAVSSDGEYEWTRRIRAQSIPKMLDVLDAAPDADILQVLREHWTGEESYELERRIRESDIPSDLSTWSG